MPLSTLMARAKQRLSGPAHLNQLPFNWITEYTKKTARGKGDELDPFLFPRPLVAELTISCAGARPPYRG